MENKGFTLVELLAVIAILAILVIIALPNIMSLFNEAKMNSFTNELKVVHKTAEQQWMNDSMFETEDIVYARTSSGDCTRSLKLSGRQEIRYYIKVNKAGKVVEYYAEDGTYQYSYNGPGLKIEEIKDIVQISDIDLSNKLTISCNRVIIGNNDSNPDNPGQDDTTDIGIPYDNEYDDYDDSSASTSYKARIKTTYYTTVQRAINAAVDNDTIYVIRNSSENITNNKTIKINLKNHILTGLVTNGANGYLLLVNGTIQKNGIAVANSGDITFGIKNDSSSAVNVKSTDTSSTYVYVIDNKNNLTFNMGNISANTTSSSYVYGIHDSGDDGVVVFNGGTINIVNQKLSAVGIHGNKEVTINGGTIGVKGGNSTGIISFKKITINDGTINSEHTSTSGNPTVNGILFNGTQGDEVIINGGKINATAGSGFVSGIDLYSGGTCIINNGEIFARTNGSTYKTAYGIQCRNGSGVIMNNGYVTAKSSSTGESDGIYTPKNMEFNGGYVRSSGSSTKTYGIRLGSNSNPIKLPSGKKIFKGTNGGYTAWYLVDE